MMKNRFLFVAMLFAALSLGFSACENPDDNEELLKRIEQLENELKNELNDLKNDKDKTDSADKDGDKDTSSDNEQNGDGTPDPDEGEGGSSDSPVSNFTPAAFSVSSTKQVYFSSANLQYHPKNDQWRFAPSQLDYIGKVNEYISSTYNGWLDLFGWSTGATNFGVSTSKNYNDYYSGYFVDWGSKPIGSDVPNTWSTLTRAEWEYLLETRTNASSLCGVAEVNGVNGLILLPDSWTCPDGITFKSGFHDDYGVEYYAAYQTFTADQWSKMEQQGAVFLPAAGDRIGYDVGGVQYDGGYWSATSVSSGRAYSLDFGSGNAFMSEYVYFYCGLSVRLVKDL